MSDERVLALEGVHNFRDYGGYAVSGGGHVRRGLLWRSGQHAEATDADLAKVAGLGLSGVFDLRSDKERRSHPCRRPPGFTARIHFASDGPSGSSIPHVAATTERRHRDAESTRAGMRQSYRSLPYRAPLNGAIRQLFVHLAAGDGPSLINCMAGKDRTGIAAMAVQLALGVHRDDVLADYLLTNTAGDPVARMAAGYRTVATIVGELDEESLKVMMGVEAEYLDIAFATIAERSGSIDNWLAEEFGADAALRERLRGQLVA